MIHKFEVTIYPRAIWVAVTRNKKELDDAFESISGGALPLDDMWIGSFEACAFRAREKETGHFGDVIWFPQRSYMTTKTIAHEAVHVALDIFEDIGVRVSYEDQEPFAYLVGFAAGCCEKVKVLKNKTKDENKKS